MLCYERRSETQRLAVFLNLGDAAQAIRVEGGTILLSSTGRGGALSGETRLEAAEGLVVSIG